MCYVTIRNLEIKTYDNPSIGGIDLGLAVQCDLDKVFVNTGVYNVQVSLEATWPGILNQTHKTQCWSV